MRLIAFIVVSVLAYVLPLWAGALVLVVYAFQYTAYELILLGALLDAHYGVTLSWLPVPILYTAGITLILIIVEALKPLMSFYEDTE